MEEVFSRGEGWSKNEISALLMALVMGEALQEHRFNQAYYLEIYHLCNVVVNDLRNRGELSELNGPEPDGNRWHYSRAFAMVILGHIRDRLEGKAWCNWRSVSVDDTLNELGITMDVILREMGEVDLV